MIDYKAMVEQSATFLEKKMDARPVIGILTGTGLGDSVAAMECKVSLDYRDIPHFPISTVSSHAGRLKYGKIADKTAMVLQGRFHLYEGYRPDQVTFPIRVMQTLGVKYLILTNASGGLNLEFSAGDLMIINDHINLTGENPLVGPNENSWGLRFPDMIQVYDREINAMVTGIAKEADLTVRCGTYVGLKGPSLETPAEMRYLRTIGADAVGFSTVMESIAGVHAGMRILGLSTITNINDPENPVPATMEAIVAVAQKAAGRINLILERVAEKI